MNGHSISFDRIDVNLHRFPGATPRARPPTVPAEQRKIDSVVLDGKPARWHYSIFSLTRDASIKGVTSQWLFSYRAIQIFYELSHIRPRPWALSQLISSRVIQFSPCLKPTIQSIY
jgi:hypothetical protein